MDGVPRRAYWRIQGMYALSSSYLLQFHAACWKNSQNNGLASSPLGLAPPRWKSWIRHWTVPWCELANVPETNKVPTETCASENHLYQWKCDEKKEVNESSSLFKSWTFILMISNHAMLHEMTSWNHAMLHSMTSLFTVRTLSTW